MSRTVRKRFGVSAALLAAATFGFIAACSNVESDLPANAQDANQANNEIASDKAAAAGEYDIVILNGRVMDPESKFDGVCNVGIKDGKIVAITEDAIAGKETIDAKDHVVVPGFIDTHTHSSDKFSIKMSMMDGVTTGLDLELGALNIAAWYEREEGKWPMNYGQAVGHEYVRMMVHDGLKFDEPIDAVNVFNNRAAAVKDDEVAGWSVTKSSLEQINQITKILDENLRQGALGIGSTPGYASAGITTYEQFEVQRSAARYKRWTGFHTRFTAQVRRRRKRNWDSPRCSPMPACWRLRC